MSSLASPTAELAKPAQNLIGGEWQEVRGHDTYEDRSPSDPSLMVGIVPLSTDDDAVAAIAAAAGAAPEWAALPAAARGAILNRAAGVIERDQERIATLMSREMGKPLREARGETLRAAAILRFFGAEGQRPTGARWEQSASGAPVYTVRRPLGVIALITPWNFPLAIPTWKLAPALAYGNTAILKLAQPAPLTGLELARALDEAGLPAGVLNVLLGSGSRVGPVLIDHPQVDAISFTGSETVGHGIRDRATVLGKKVQLELGGQNPLIVMDDAPLTRAAGAAVAGAFWSAGQKCTATRRILVHERVYDAFLETLREQTGRAVVGDAEDAATEVGPLVSEAQLDDVVAGIDRGRGEAQLLAGGERLDRTGWFVAPTIFADAAPDAFLSCEEIFGPVTTVSRVGDLDEAIARANDVRFGLSASIFTGSIATAHAFAARAQAGMLHINSQTAGAEIHVPFGGIKSSAWGPHEQGTAAVEFYTDQITVYEDA
jgi:acyl-CoA reductase-like NAD-dependent aldehyde dehydrogenase